MEKIIWSKITEAKEICTITINSTVIGKLIVDKDPIDNKKWMCSFEGFPYRQIFCFDNKMDELHGLYSKEIAKKEIFNQFVKVIKTLHIFASEISKQYLG